MNHINEVTHIESVRLADDGTGVIIIDQTQLPNRTEYLTLTTAEDIWEAIYHLKVRVRRLSVSVRGMVSTALPFGLKRGDYGEFLREFRKYKKYLDSARPTAVNLSWALNRMERVVTENSDKEISVILKLLKDECRNIHQEDIGMCRAISEYGLSLLKDGDGILTHCNAGPLATSRYGTGQGPLFLGKERGMNFRVMQMRHVLSCRGRGLRPMNCRERG